MFKKLSFSIFVFLMLFVFRWFDSQKKAIIFFSKTMTFNKDKLIGCAFQQLLNKENLRCIICAIRIICIANVGNLKFLKFFLTLLLSSWLFLVLTLMLLKFSTIMNQMFIYQLLQSIYLKIQLLMQNISTFDCI